MTTMRTSPEGIAAIAMHEGIVPFPYLDSAGVYTVGIGHTASAGEPDPAWLPKGQEIPLDEIFAIFRRDLAKFERGVSNVVTVPVAQHEFDALVSFHFNTGGIARANLTAALNRGDRKGAASGFMGWLKPLEIRGRREAEMRLFRDGIYPNMRIPVYDVTATNRPGRVARTLSAAEVVAMLEPPAPPAATVQRLDAGEYQVQAGLVWTVTSNGRIRIGTAGST